MKVTAIFDIGKTNKKFFLFDDTYQEVYKEYTRLEELTDEVGFPCDDIEGMQAWMKKTLTQAMGDPRFEITKLNFSGYGASFVHVDERGMVLPPLYNYLKPFPKGLLTSFHQKYGDPQSFAQATASPPLGMLNSGLQLYWLKYTKPKLFQQIKWSMHLPQFLSFLFTGKAISDYTSIGCHTGLWDMEKNEYHTWVYAEGIDKILPPIVDTGMSLYRTLEGRALQIGVGVHDSSAALLPYTRFKEEPFMVLSTGTWSICLNPFNQEALSTEDLQKDCLQFLSPSGTKIKASRLFLGNEYKTWTARLAEYFQRKEQVHRRMNLDMSLVTQLAEFPTYTFHWEKLPSAHRSLIKSDLSQFESYELAYHKLIQELIDLQVQSIYLAKGRTPIKYLFIDGGFVDNEIFLYFLTEGLKDIQLIPTQKPLGSAIGAAMILHDTTSPTVSLAK